MSVHLSRRARITIWLQATAAAASVVGVTLWLESGVLSEISSSYPLRLGVAFGLTHLLAAGAISLHLMGSKWRAHLARQRADRETQSIRAALTEYALGQAGMSTVVGQYRRYPRIFRETIFEVLTLVDGKPRERLAHVAEQLGIANRWLQGVRSGVVRRRLAAVRAIGFIPTLRTRRALRRALDDDDVNVQLAAAHALVRHGHPHDLEHVLEYAAQLSPWSRAILGQAMEGSAAVLERRAIPIALTSHEPDALVAVLQFVKLWQVRLTPDAVTPLHEHPDPRVRALAVATLPQVDGLGELVSSLERGLSDEADDVRAAAASVVGRMKVRALAARLEECLAAPDPRLQLSAAVALAQLGTDGVVALERAANQDDADRNQIAAEVAEKARIGRLQLATI